MKPSAAPRNSVSSVRDNTAHGSANKLGPVRSVSEGESAAEALLTIEETARNARTPEKLFALLANQTRKLTGARQVFVFQKDSGFTIKSVSGLVSVDNSAPTVKGMAEVVEYLVSKRAEGRTHALNLGDLLLRNRDLLKQYPFKAILWVPLKGRDGDVLGGVILSRERPFSEDDSFIAKRIMATFSHALEFLLLSPAALPRHKRQNNARRVVIGCAVALCIAIAMFVPVTMTTLAQVEVTPRNPFLLASALDASIEAVLVEPNEPVKMGQALVRFEQTSLLNALEIAKREIAVAEARVKKANLTAFTDPKGLHDLSIAKAEHDLQVAAFERVKANFDRTILYAQQDGVAIFPDKQELIGKPVKVGERIMRIADPQQVELTMKIALSDSIPLNAGDPVQIYLDSNPFSSRDATVRFANYDVQTDGENAAHFRVFAELSDDFSGDLRLGTRGSAKIYGEQVSLGFYLFRKPISALRQWLGV